MCTIHVAYQVCRLSHMLRPTGDALLSCGRIAAATGAALLCENAFARVDRGAGLPNLQRVPYFPQVPAVVLLPNWMLLCGQDAPACNGHRCQCNHACLHWWPFPN